MINACADSTYVIHTASPVNFKMPEEELVKAAVDGTMAVMKACTKHKVKRLVITSSIAAVVHCDESAEPPKDEGYNETYWSNP